MAIDVVRIETLRQRASRTAAPARTDGDPPSLLRRLAAARIPFLESKKVSVDHLVLFTQQLALLLQTGNSLVPSIKALASQTGSPAFRAVLQDVHDRLEQGAGLSDCLAQHPNAFDHLFVSLVRAGEATGALSESLRRLCGILEVRRRLRARILEAMTYPIVLSVIMTGVVIFIMTYMVPRFAVIFADLGDQLPLSTRLFLNASGFLRSRWWILIPIILLVGSAFRWLWKTAAAREAWDRLRMRTPFVGRLYLASCLYQLTSTLGLLLESRVPLMEAIGIVREVIHNVLFRRLFADLARNVETGRGFAQAFQEADFLPDSMKLMVSTGEASGALDVVMTRLADRYREDLESDIRRLGSLLEPAMLVVMGTMVGFIAISFILPIFKMSRVVH